MSRSTFCVLFYANKSKLKNGVVPIMGRVTINGTQSQFSCKQSIPLALWDVKGNRAKGRSREALQLNRDLDYIKAQLIKHYQDLSDKKLSLRQRWCAMPIKALAASTRRCSKPSTRTLPASRSELARTGYALGNATVKKERGKFYSDALSPFRYVDVGTDSRLYQGLCRLP